MLENIIVGPVIVIENDKYLKQITNDLLFSKGIFSIAYNKGLSYVDDMGVEIPKKDRHRIQGSIITILYRRIETDNDRRQTIWSYSA